MPLKYNSDTLPLQHNTPQCTTPVDNYPSLSLSLSIYIYIYTEYISALRPSHLVVQRATLSRLPGHRTPRVKPPRIPQQQQSHLKEGRTGEGDCPCVRCDTMCILFSRDLLSYVTASSRIFSTPLPCMFVPLHLSPRLFTHLLRSPRVPVRHRHSPPVQYRIRMALHNPVLVPTRIRPWGATRAHQIPLGQVRGELCP